jgi:hypothetical protein
MGTMVGFHYSEIEGTALEQTSARMQDKHVELGGDAF